LTQKVKELKSQNDYAV
jgi:hypothetical protein